MYVCQLDRPWLSTPFPFQGFVIRGDKDIATLRKYCNWVYVDVLRGVPPQADSALDRPWRTNGVTKEIEETRLEFAADPRVTTTHKARGGAEALDDLQEITSVPIKVRTEYYSDPKQFQRELKRADQLHRDLAREVSQVIDDIRVGRGLDANGVQRTARHMVSSVIRHPDALIWIIRLRDRDSYSYSHSIRAAVFAAVLGRHLGLSERQLDRLAMGSLLCEVGKARLPRQLLEKKAPLNEQELERLRGHVQAGVEILDRCLGIGDDVIEIVQNHHERFNGSGYPNGKAGDQIPLLARIAGLVDTYDAMTSLKPYTDRIFSPPEATDFLYDQRDVLFQGQLVEEFIQALGIYPTGTLVELSSGEVALITEQNPRKRIQPVVLPVLSGDKKPYSKYRKVDLRRHNRSHEDDPLSIKRALAAGEYGLDPNAIMEQHAAQKFDWRRLAFG